MKKILSILLFISILKSAFASGEINFSTHHNFQLNQNYSNASLKIKEKIKRRIFYLGNLGYSYGYNNEYNSSQSYSLLTNNGLGFQFSNEFSAAINIGYNYDNFRTEKKASGNISLSASYKLWN
jgi:hypothetical protein